VVTKRFEWLFHDLLLPKKEIEKRAMTILPVSDFIEIFLSAIHVQLSIFATKSTSLNLYVLFSAVLLKNIQPNLL